MAEFKIRPYLGWGGWRLWGVGNGGNYAIACCRTIGVGLAKDESENQPTYPNADFSLEASDGFNRDRFPVAPKFGEAARVVVGCHRWILSR